MLPETQPSLRVAMARAIHQTTEPHTLMRLASVTELLSLLDTWLVQADADRQSTLLHATLRALAVLPFSRPQLRGHPVLKTIRKLHKHRHAGVAAAATSLGQQWAAADAALMVQRVAVPRKVLRCAWICTSTCTSTCTSPLQPVIPSRIQQAGAVAASAASSWLPPAHSVPAVPKPAIPRQPSYVCLHEAACFLSHDAGKRQRQSSRPTTSCGPGNGKRGWRNWEASAQTSMHRRRTKPSARDGRLQSWLGCRPWIRPRWLLVWRPWRRHVHGRWCSLLLACRARRHCRPRQLHRLHAMARVCRQLIVKTSQVLVPAGARLGPTIIYFFTELAPATTAPAAVRPIPWFPKDPHELAQQDAKLQAAGLRLSHQLGQARGRGRLPAAGRGRGLPMKRPRPVNIPGFR